MPDIIDHPSGQPDVVFSTYAGAEYTASRIANAKFIGFEQGGHLWVGHHDEVMRAVVAHLTTTARP